MTIAQRFAVERTRSVAEQRLQELGGQARHLAALTGSERHVPEAALAGERANEHGEGVVGRAEVRRVDLAGVAGEDDLRLLADPGQDRLERRGLQVLGLVDDRELAVERTAPQERDRLERE